MTFRPEGCLTPNEAGKRLGITGECVKQWIGAGKLKAAKLANGYWLVRETDLDEYVEAQKNLEFKLHGSRVNAALVDAAKNTRALARAGL